MPNLDSIMQDTMGPVFAIIMILMGGISVVLLVAAFLAARTPSKSNDWPAATGQVLVSTINYRRSGGSRAAYPLVMYTYQVEGRTYQSQRIYFGSLVGGSAMAGLVKKYPVGAQAPVYYNPQNSADAVLERSIPMAKMLGLTSLILIGVAAVVYFMSKLFGL